jgi:ADP-ribose pyrophosphatase YjhB (NUDIX family)
VEHGEHPADAVVRELAEETGLAGLITSGPLVLSDVVELPARGMSVHTVRVIYEVDVLREELTAERDGTSDAPAWVELSALGDLDLQPFVVEALTRLGRG